MPPTGADLWRILLPLLAGAASIYLLLPRPRPFNPLIGLAAGVAALVLAGALLLKPVGLSPESVLFYSFSALAVASGALLATQQNPARAALSFTLVILSTCGLFLLLAAPFLMAATIIVYAGAIIVTFLFVIMLAQQEGYSDADARSREPGLAVLTGFLLLAVLLHVVRLANDNSKIDGLMAEAEAFKASGKPLSAQKLAEAAKPDAQNLGPVETRVSDLLKELGHSDLAKGFEGYEFKFKQKTEEEKKATAAAVMDECRRLLAEARQRGMSARPRPAEEGKAPARPARPMSAHSGAPASVPHDQIRRDPKTGVPEMPADNAAALGRSLFTDYLLPVELGGFLLLVATVGAIAIAQKHKQAEGVRG